MLAVLYHKLNSSIDQIDERRGYKSFFTKSVIYLTKPYPFKLSVGIEVPLQEALQRLQEILQQMEDAQIFLKKGNLHQRLRKEIQYSLMPTTLEGSS